MRVGICFFMESNLGGAATQADDMVTAARRLGHESCLLRFTTSPRSRDIFGLGNGLPKHFLKIDRAGMRFSSPKILLDGKKETAKWLDTFDLLVFVGGCPHITRSFAEEDFGNYYGWIYTNTRCRKIMFFTDPFWQKLYPYCKEVIGNMDGVYAFAEAYRKMVVDSGLHEEVGICNFGSVAAFDLAGKNDERKSKESIVWPHQWRSWKNPHLLIRVSHYLERRVEAYADGIEYHKLRRDYWADWSRAVRRDLVKDQDLFVGGKITYHGTAPQPEILEEFSTCKWMLDFTGMSGRTGEPIPKFIGNYQCVNIECMMLGCVNFKFVNTVDPYSQIPSDCVISMPLVTDPRKLAKFINSNLGLYKKTADRAREWSMDNFNPTKAFQKCFLN